MRVRDVTFEGSPQDKSPKGEAAMFVPRFKAGRWTKKIVLFQSLKTASDASFSYTIAHEMGHAIDHAPAEGAAGLIAKGSAHDDPKFMEAAAKDGGRAKAITHYAATDDDEFFAECFALFIQQPETLNALRPHIYAFFNEYQWGALQNETLNPLRKGRVTHLVGAGPRGLF